MSSRGGRFSNPHNIRCLTVSKPMASGRRACFVNVASRAVERRLEVPVDVACDGRYADLVVLARNIHLRQVLENLAEAAGGGQEAQCQHGPTML